MLFGIRSRGVTRALARPVDDRLRGCSFEIWAVEDPRTIRKRMDGIDLSVFSGEPQRLLADAEEFGCPGEVQLH